MHPAAARALFDADICTLTQALASRRGWFIHSTEFPVVDCSFTAAARTTLRLKLMCDNWNDLPPSISLHTADGTLLMKLPPNLSGVFNSGPHPTTGRPFICMKGSLEYHTHPSHLADPWGENLRNSSSYTIGGILTQIWNAWLKGTG